MIAHAACHAAPRNLHRTQRSDEKPMPAARTTTTIKSTRARPSPLVKAHTTTPSWAARLREFFIHLLVAASMAKLVTLEELGKHNTSADCWIAIHGNVYDVTAFLPEHPGMLLNIK